ncbi:MAG: adenylate/guanylate cyclase domain-containing protein, partial [Acidimicrobiia bacterium]|nr:adenylate/guanylate cyclase domain-containing protein [Acidimicrobiia bacterium]
MVTTEAESLPTGNVAFLFTDIEGSTRMVAELGEEWVTVLQKHNQILNDAVAARGGFPIKSEGDSLFAVFAESASGVSAAVDIQRGLVDEPWPDGHAVRVRVGVHTGDATVLGRDYVGLEVHRAARISDAAHGGQIVVSEPTVVAAEGPLAADGVTFEDLGKYRLKDLADPEALFQVHAEGLESNFPPLRTIDAIRNNLPAQLTTFVGRDYELKEAMQLLERTHILTLTGPGGTGKTRLGLQLAAEMSHRFEDGVFFVDLSPVTEPELVPSSVLNALGVSASGQDETPQERLMSQLREKSVLLVLDNFEQLLDAGPLVADMLASSPRSKFIVTSRAPLRIRGEQEMPIPPLETAPASTVEEALEREGVHLFAERATAIRPDFTITTDNLASVNELVERLDGLPLAIELVASRLRLLSVEQILDRLDAQLLSAGSLDLPERQRTITSAIDWSYSLLGPVDQAMFRRFSVFSGGARLEEIEAFCSHWGMGAHSLATLETLVEHSLLRVVEGREGASRFRMLHVIREFAAQALDQEDDSAESSRAHLEVYADFVDGIAPDFLASDRERSLNLVEEDHDNIRAALDWGMAQGEVDLVLRLSAATWRFWQARGHLHEGTRRLTDALSLEGGDPRLRAKALEALGGIYWWRGDFARCVEIYGQALEMWRDLDDDRELANALYNYGLAVGFEADDQTIALPLLEESREIYLRLDDVAG